MRVCRWLEEAGVDAIHVSTGSSFPHPRNPPGAFPIAEAAKTYNTMLGSGAYTLRNYLLFQAWPFNRIFQWRWESQGVRPEEAEGALLGDSRAIKQAVGIPVLCTGGFQTASVIREAIRRGDCDAVTIARPLVANNDLVHLFAQGHDRPPRPCTYCNKCLLRVLEYPLGCYEESRYKSREEMLQEIFSVFEASRSHERPVSGAIGPALRGPEA